MGGDGMDIEDIFDWLCKKTFWPMITRAALLEVIGLFTGIILHDCFPSKFDEASIKLAGIFGFLGFLFGEVLQLHARIDKQKISSGKSMETDSVIWVDNKVSTKDRSL